MCVVFLFVVVRCVLSVVCCLFVVRSLLVFVVCLLRADSWSLVAVRWLVV